METKGDALPSLNEMIDPNKEAISYSKVNTVQTYQPAGHSTRNLLLPLSSVSSESYAYHLIQRVDDLIHSFRNLLIGAVRLQEYHLEFIERAPESVQKQDFLSFRHLNVETGYCETVSKIA